MPIPAMTTSPQRFTVRSGDVVVRGDLWAATSGAPTVLLVPGGGETRTSWTRTARALAAQGIGALTLDLRGHGGSDRSATADYGVDALVGDVLAASSSLPEPPVVAGASLSGLTALLAASECPTRVRGLVMVDSAIDVRQLGLDRVLGFMESSRTGFDTLEEFAVAVAGFTGASGSPGGRTQRHVRQGDDGRWYWHWDPVFIERPPDFAGDRERLVSAARRVSVPTLLIRGQDSDVVADADAAALRALIPHAELHEITGADHRVVGDQHDLVADRLARFAAAT